VLCSPRLYLSRKLRKPAEKECWHVGPLLGNNREISNCTTVVAKWWLCKQRPLLGNCLVAITCSPQQTRTQQLHCSRGKLFSTRSVLRCYKQGQLAVAVSWWASEWDNSGSTVVVSCYCEKLIAEAGDSSGTQRKGNVRRWKPLPSNGSEDVTVENRERERLCVCVCVCAYMRACVCVRERETFLSTILSQNCSKRNPRIVSVKNCGFCQSLTE
jgi:hypothetical protein